MSETNARSTADAESETGNESAADAGLEADSSSPRTSSLERVEALLLVAVGGFAGATLRHAVAVALSATALLPDAFPWGTLAVNVAGSLALGFLLYEARVAGQLSPQTRLVFGTGFLSSFTTYSTFAAQTTALSPTLAVANVGANYALGFAAVLAGRFAVRSLATGEVAK